MSAELEVRSFRSVFALERRIYRIDTLRLNPGGVPLRGIAYAASLVSAALVAGTIPPTAWLNPLLPWYLRDIGAPLAAAILLGAVRIDGRPFHRAAASLIAYALGSRVLYSLVKHRDRLDRWHPPSLLLLPDGSDASFRRLRYRGPGAVLVTRPHVRRHSRFRRAAVTLHPVAAGAESRAVIELADSGVLEVRPR